MAFQDIKSSSLFSLERQIIGLQFRICFVAFMIANNKSQLIIIVCMSISLVHCDDSWVDQLEILSKYVKETIEFLDNYNETVSKRSPSYRYPLNGYIKAWKLCSQSLENRIKVFKEHKAEVLLSTMLNWVMPIFATAYNDLYIYIKRSLKEAQNRIENAELSEQQCLDIYNECKLESTFQLKKADLESILKLPFLFIQGLLERAVHVSDHLNSRISFLQKQIKQEKDEIQPINIQKINLLIVQIRQLKSALNNFNSCVEFLNMEDNHDKQVNRDNTVLKHTIVNKQYSQVPKTQKNMTLAYRIKLICRWKKLQKRRVQRLKERRMKILQLIDGEQRYIAGLVQYIQQIKVPIQRSNFLSLEQRKLIFSTIVEIKQLHQDMYDVLRKEYQNYTDSQCYGLILIKFIPFFKLYTEYILNATEAQKLLQDLSKTSKEIGEICKKYTDSTSKVAHNELSQPTFRIARYEMLFQGIIKSTCSTHPDREYFKNCLKIFSTTLTQVNNQVDKIIRRNRLNQLEAEFGSILPIYVEGREFLKQFSLILIKQPRPENISLIVFTDLVLVVQQETRKLMKQIVVDQNFFSRRQEDNKIYRNMITIHSDGFITFTAGSEDVKANLAEQVYQVLKKITKDSGQQVYVQVIGTEEIGSTSFAKYTEYIIEVKYLDLKKLLHMRFSNVNDMVCIMQNHYKNDLKITEEETLKKSWFNSHKSKVIEARKIMIAQIFMKLFNHPLIKAQPNYFLNYLNLPQNFYDIARTSYEKRISMGQSTTVSCLKRSYLTKKEERQAFTILCATEIELGRDLFHDMDNNEQLKKLKEISQKIQIKVFTLTSSEPQTIKITQFDTVEDVCNKVSTLIGLRSNRDFRLFHEIGKKQLRVLDHEQILCKIFDFPKPQQDIIVGFVDNLKSTIQRIVSPKTLPTLIFKKYYYLPFETQQLQFRRDLTRLRLMVFQVFAEIYDMKYQLTFDQYLLFLAMLIYIELDGEIANKKQIDPSIVHRIIPSTVYKLKNYSEEEWLEKCDHHLNRLRQQIDKVIEYNRGQLKQRKIRADTVSKMALYFGHKHLCSQIVLNKIKMNSIFGSNIFYVQPHSSCYKKLQEKGLKVAYNMWLAVKVDSLDLLTPSSKESVLNLKYTDIEKGEVFSESVVIRTAGAIEENFRLNTYQSFQISQLIRYYKALNQAMNNLKQSSSLNVRVKSYRDQLLEYRHTYEEESAYSMIK